MNKFEIITSLPKLSAQDRGDIALAIKAIQQMGDAGESSRTARATKDPLFDAIGAYLSRLGLLTGSPSSLQFRSAYDVYKKKRPEVYTFLEKLAGSTGASGRFMPQVAFIATTALGDWLMTRKLFGVSSMLSQIDKIPEAIDLAFPGYLSAGLFGFILLSTDQNPLKVKEPPCGKA